MSAWPPQRKHDPLPVPQEFALKMLSQYIADTQIHPYLLPNAKLEPSGPAAGSSNSIIIRNLQRVEAGLKGEWLAPVVDLEVAVAEGLEKEDAAAEGWQNLEDYQLEQEDLDGEVAPDTTAVQQEGDDEEGDIEYGGEEADAPAPKPLKRKNVEADYESQAKKPKDKETRKQEKKEKLKREKREKEEKRKAAQAQESE